MYVVLARHGNTFDPGDRPVWVGARTDLPLVAKGHEQGRRIGEALKAANLVPRRTLAGPLKRTRETASLALAAADRAGATVEIEDRLREIDYGTWEGKSSDELRGMGWDEELRAWDHDNVWPSDAGWLSSAAEHVGGFLAVLDNVRRRADDPTLIVSSNGILKLFASSVSGSTRNSKMGTGHLALLRLTGVRPDILCWDLAPDAFVEWAGRNRL